jgi:hypothetical protein
MNGSITQHGFTWGCIEVERTADLSGGRAVLTVKTPRRRIEVYVSATGLIRVWQPGKGEWKVVPPKDSGGGA